MAEKIELTSLDIKFKYRTEGAKKVEELRESFEKVAEAGKHFNKEATATNRSLKKVESGIRSLLGEFAPPMTKWYNAAKSIYDVYKGMAQKGDKSDASKDAAIFNYLKFVEKRVNISKRFKTLQETIFKRRQHLFKLDDKTNKGLKGYGLSVLGVAGAYGLWSGVPPIIMGLVGAFLLLSLSLGRTGSLVGILKRVALPVGLAMLALNFDSVSSFFKSLLGGAKETTDSSTATWESGLSVTTKAAETGQVQTTMSLDQMATGTSMVMGELSRIAQMLFTIQLPSVTKEGMENATSESNKWFVALTNIIKVGSNYIGNEFISASVKVMTYARALSGITSSAVIAEGAVRSLLGAYRELGGSVKPSIQATKSKPFQERALQYGTGGAAVGSFFGPFGGLVGALGGFFTGTGIAASQTLMERGVDPIKSIVLGTGSAGPLIASMVDETGQQAGGNISRGGFARIHKGEDVVPDQKGVNIVLNLNLKATTPTNFSQTELRELAQKISSYQTKELYRRQTTLL